RSSTATLAPNCLRSPRVSMTGSVTIALGYRLRHLHQSRTRERALETEHATAFRPEEQRAFPAAPIRGAVGRHDQEPLLPVHRHLTERARVHGDRNQERAPP